MTRTMNPNRRARGRYRAAPGVVSSSRRRPRLRLRLPGIRTLLGATAALSIGVGGAVVAAGGSYAYLNATVAVGDGGSIASGTAALTLTRGAGAATSALTIPAAVYAGMLPGDIVNQSITLTNAGNTTLLVTASATSDGAWDTRVASGACPATQLGTTALGTTPVSYATLAAAGTSTVCLQVVLPASAPAATMNTSITYTVTFDGTQVAS
ncbi:hypothetical protein [Protaetiibacter mangrovi]|uniref:Ribosomally synthesized peptide with SipW-like signal peptide n=1 Tax=Protaetiibacter mangrovi TaxID=2970926 RepID=A0ABT1ZIG8_9MICO|nr:hypothetical protein [Protaetiibacter mangrovi]MCS0500495.1 hypothetical protein [Protaetiibacter mangrovi]TPX03924.1 hypothetical protein FJ656_14565 [Schumannella luteola]